MATPRYSTSFVGEGFDKSQQGDLGSHLLWSQARCVDYDPHAEHFRAGPGQRLAEWCMLLGC